MIQQSLVLMGKKDLRWTSKTLPPLGKNEILIKTLAGAISVGSELPQYMESDRTVESPHYPKGTGYESYGEVIQTGAEVQSLKPGDKVVAFYGHQDYGIVHETKTIIPPKETDPALALLSILSCDSAKGVLKLNPKRTDKVLVTGMGTMGLLSVYFLKEYMNVGHVDVLEPNASRRNLAFQFGASHAYRDESECPHDSYQYGLECSASNEAFHTLQSALTTNGSICILSDGNRDRMELQAAFYEKELKIVGSSDGWDYQEHAKWYFENLKQTRAPLKKLFEWHISKEDLIGCFRVLSEAKNRPIKVLVHY